MLHHVRCRASPFSCDASCFPLLSSPPPPPQMDSLLSQYYAQLEEEQRAMRAVVEGVMEGHQSSKEARQKMQQTKHAIGEGCAIVSVCVLLPPRKISSLGGV